MVPALKFYKFINEQIPIRLSNELIPGLPFYRFPLTLNALARRLIAKQTFQSKATYIKREA
jgi:hypothetical protein